MSEWGAQNLQAVWFIQPREIDAATIFAGIVGAKPDNTQKVTVGSTVAVGSDGISQFQVTTQPGRIDYFETLVSNIPAEFPLFVDVKNAIGAFTGRIINGSHSVGVAQRLAIVINLCKRVEAAGDFLQALNSLVGSETTLSDASDIIFQVNRRRAIPGSDGLSMNRLFRMQPQVVQQIDPNNPLQPPINTVEIVSLSVDCNTHSVTPPTLEPDEQISIWKELALEAERLCAAKSINALS
jgi:hypothetical protein